LPQIFETIAAPLRVLPNASRRWLRCELLRTSD
jgi:hypothetical protein